MGSFEFTAFEKTAFDVDVPAVSLVVTSAGDIEDIQIGSSIQLTATATLEDDTVVDATLASSWSTSDADIISITQTGIATAVSAGRAEITATFGVAGSIDLVAIGISVVAADIAAEALSFIIWQFRSA